MDQFEFFSSIVGSLAWPLASIAIVAMLRSPISSLILTMTKLKYKDLELDFGRALARAEEVAKTIDIQPEPKQLASEKEDRNSSQILHEASHLANDFPEPAVALAWNAIEYEIMDAVKRLGISPDYPPYNSALKNITLLQDAGLLDERTLDLLKRMKTLRNMAIHGGACPRITTNEVREFIALSTGIVDRIKALKRSENY